MAIKKGEKPKNFNSLEKYNLRNRTPEERHEITMKSVQKRRENKKEKMALQKCMQAILELNIANDKQRAVLKQFGIEDEHLVNKTLLMVSLFMKGAKGDVTAIKEIINMMDRLDILQDTGNITQGININLVQVGNETKQNRDETEDDELWDNEEWGLDVYKPET